MLTISPVLLRLDWFLDLGLLAVGVTALVLGVSNTHCSAS